MTLSRPLPDVRDGLSLVQRRVLPAMRDGGLVPGGAFKRSAAIAREVSKRFRPRARDSSHDALVAMVRDFTLRYPLIEVRETMDRSTNHADESMEPAVLHAPRQERSSPAP
jgi:DNA gyrase/topoisomerase IV subunit A